MHDLIEHIEQARQLILSAMSRHARDMNPAEAEEFFRAEVEAMVQTLLKRHWDS